MINLKTHSRFNSIDDDSDEYRDSNNYEMIKAEQRSCAPEKDQRKFSFGIKDNFKSDFVDSVKPRDWNNIPIPIVECIEKVLFEFESLNFKLNK